MDSADSLPRLQVPPTYPFPEPENPVHAPQSHFLKIHLTVVNPSAPGSSKWSLYLRFPHQSPLCTSSHHHACYMPRPSNSSGFDQPNNIWWGVQISKILMMYFSPLPCYLVTLRPKYSPHNPILKYPQTALFPHCERPCFTPTQKNRQNYIFCI